MCGLISASTTALPYRGVCHDLSGRYKDCSDVQKAQHILKTWFEDINLGTDGFCCSGLGQPDWGIDRCTSSATICRNIDINPLCHVDWDSTQPTADEREFVFNTQCGYLANFGGDHNNACDDISLDGIFKECDDDMKANYILNVWSSLVKSNKECCADITILDPSCVPIVVDCSPLISETECTLPSDVTQQEITRFIQEQCKKVSTSFKFQSACNSIQSNGVLFTCPLRERANYVLGLWYANNDECCADLATGGDCYAPEPPTPLPTPSPIVPRRSSPTKRKLFLSSALRDKGYLAALFIVLVFSIFDDVSDIFD